MKYGAVARDDKQKVRLGNNHKSKKEQRNMVNEGKGTLGAVHKWKTRKDFVVV